MKKALLLIPYFVFCISSSFAQSGTWTWISGDSAANSAGAYGTQGIPSVNNYPPAIYDALEWKDKQGNFWIYGGTYYYNTDLWKFNPSTLEWTWVKGNGLSNQVPIYGTRGVANAANTPGVRSYTAPTWVDTSGALWLSGGNGAPDDVWKYDIASNMWTWVKGDSVPNTASIHGTMGIANKLNTPGNRDGTCSAWIDSLNNLWLFGGFGYEDDSMGGGFEDLWKYNISDSEWTWMKGLQYVDIPPMYGIKGVADTSNEPGGRFSYTKWKDQQGNFWIMGGLDYNIDLDVRNDVWKYDLSTNNWTWMSGPDTLGGFSNYTASCNYATTNVPDSREYDRSAATDNCGKFWLFGGFADDGNLNDLWVFDPQQVKWNLARANDLSSNFGHLGVPSLANMPHSRGGAVAWWGNDNKFYMFGGQLGDQATLYGDMWVFDPDTSCVPSCNVVTVPPPVADFQTSQTTLCANDCISFTDLSTNATSWKWSFNGAADSTSSSQNPQNICYPSGGIYNVRLIASNAGGSDTVTFMNYINVIAAPPTPGITQHNDTLYCSTDTAYHSYQWYLDTVLIAGATDTFLVVTHSGDFSVKVSNRSGCITATSINIILGIQNYANNNIITLFPNPATDQLTISGGGKTEAGDRKLTVFNVFGEVIYTEEINGKQATVNCKLFPAGVYFVQVVTEKERWVARFIKE